MSGCRACRRPRGRIDAPARASRPCCARRAESAAGRAAPAWWRTGNSSGRARRRAHGERTAAAGQRARGHASGQSPSTLASSRGREQVAEFDRLVALDAGHRRLTRQIAGGKTIDHGFLGSALVVEHVVGMPMRSATARASWMSCPAAGALAVRRRAMVVELQRHADDVAALGLEQRRGDRKESTPPGTWRRRGIVSSRPSTSVNFASLPRQAALQIRFRRNRLPPAHPCTLL